MKATLLVLAAGMGSRYGGLKQMDPFGPHGETIIDYSIYDAKKAGFEKVVFVVRQSFRDDFEAYFRKRIGDHIEMDFVVQELYEVPPGSRYLAARQKPWGTAHAVMMGAQAIKGPFAVINADDYYGVESYQTLIDFFKKNKDKAEYAVVAYLLKNTLSDHGTVNRGVCQKNSKGYLTDIVETLKISKGAGGISYPKADGSAGKLSPDTLVSMNMFGFFPSYFKHSEKYFKDFLKQRGLEEKSEYFIPYTLDKMIDDKKAKVKVLTSPSSWFGVTYKKDKPFVVKKINDLIKKGVYPSNLWGIKNS
jgi:NDP-sugar pyrophosphorylase family protein